MKCLISLNIIKYNCWIFIFQVTFSSGERIGYIVMPSEIDDYSVIAAGASVANRVFWLCKCAFTAAADDCKVS